MDLFAGIFALLGFVIVVVTGVVKGVPLIEILARGLLALIAFALVGWISARLGRRIALAGARPQAEGGDVVDRGAGTGADRESGGAASYRGGGVADRGGEA